MIGGGPPPTLVDMRLLYMASSGVSDPTRASVPIHLAVNGSVAVGQDVGLVLAGDATELLDPDVLASLEGIGLPPMRELFAKASAAGVPVYV